MSNGSAAVRVLLAAIVVLILGGSVLGLIQLTDTALSIQHRLSSLPWWFSVPIAFALLGLGLALLWLLARILFPRTRRAAKVAPLSIELVRERAQKLIQSASPHSPLAEQLSQQVHQELDLLEQRSQQAMIYVALFGEVNTGKSSLIKTLLGVELNIDVIAGSTSSIELYPFSLGDDSPQTVILADVPGTNEARAGHLAALAREEALRAHVVALVVNGDLSRSAALEWLWLKQFGKPMWLILNKIDQYSAEERAQLLTRLSARFGKDVLAVQASHQREVWVRDVQGKETKETRSVGGDVSALTQRLQSLALQQREALEVSRRAAILAGLDLKLAAGERQQRHEVGTKLIAQFTKRAVLGAVAAVAPGTDLVIQGALALGLMHQLCALYAVSITQIELDHLLQGIGGKLKGSVVVVVAVIGNGLKAFPGLGTLSGGALHAIAYGLLFDRLGHALLESLEQAQLSTKPVLNQADLIQRLEASLSDTPSLLRQAQQLAKFLKPGA